MAIYLEGWEDCCTYEIADERRDLQSRIGTHRTFMSGMSTGKFAARMLMPDVGAMALSFEFGQPQHSPVLYADEHATRRNRHI